MDYTLIDTIEYKGYIIEKHYDECGENPFENWDGQGRFYCWDNGKEEYSRYCELLGYDPYSREPDGDPDPDAVKIDKYEHSCIYYSVSGEGTQCRWDTSKGWAVWYPDKAILDSIKDLTGQARRDKIVELARQACELFNQWANGDVYGYIIYGPEKVCNDCGHRERENIDSCWGYYGASGWENALSEARSIIDRR